MVELANDPSVPGPFVHLRVASGYSLQYGASHPSALVARAVELGMDTLAITDRDGLYGAVRFAKACLRQGVAPVVGVDFAVAPASGRAAVSRPVTAARGGEFRDHRLSRVVVLATGHGGWAALCRLVTAVHLAGERGAPMLTPALLAEHRGPGGDSLLVMMGSDSAVGRALSGTPDSRRAEAELRRFTDLVGPANVVIAVTDQLVGGDGVDSDRQAAALLRFADGHGLRAVLTNNVRMVDRAQAATCDVLDATRRLVPLAARNIDRRNAEGWLKPGDQMAAIADHLTAMTSRAGGGSRLLADTRSVAEACRLDPHADIGLGQVHLPEFEVLSPGSAQTPAQVLRQRCEAGIASRYGAPTEQVTARLDEELATIAELGYEPYFLTVADVVGLVRGLGVRCAARGSGAGSLVNYLLGISGVDPLAYGLIMERFLSPLRQALPDIDLDVESARRTEIYQKILETFGGQRVACVAMIETYRVRHAVRDVGAALSLPPVEVDAIAKAFPHIRARDARAALRDLPELRAAGLGAERLATLFELVESLDGLPRHLALHPCGVLLSDAGLGDRTPLQASFGGFPMSQFDKDDVEDLGFLKLDVLGIRMQSALAHALGEIERTEGRAPDIDALAPFDDPGTWDLIQHAQTLGCFQIESPGQRELVGKFGLDNFDDLIVDISLFRPGPVKSNMVVPFLNARQGWDEPHYLHPSLEPALAETGGVVVFHEQVIRMIAVVTGCSLAQGDEVRRTLDDAEGQQQARAWFVPRARLRGYDRATIEKIWAVLCSFASFGFCKAHAAAFALPTYQSAWLKRHYPAHFLAGLLVHDPGMYPKRLIIEEARRMHIAILGLDVNASAAGYRVEQLPARYPTGAGQGRVPAGLPDGSAWGIRLALSQVQGISADDVQRIEAGQPYQSLSDFCARARVDFPVAENLVLTGGFDRLYGMHGEQRVQRPGQVTRRDLLLALADLKRVAMAEARVASRARGLRQRRSSLAPASDDPADLARRQAVGEVIPARARERFTGVQLALDFADPAEPSVAGVNPWSSEWGDADPWGDESLDALPTSDRSCPAPDGHQLPMPADVVASGLPEMDRSERLAAELDILGLDASEHVIESYREFLVDLGTTWSTELLGRRNRSELLVAGVKVATQTPPVRSGRRVIFLTVDDSTGPVDATFFEDVQGPYAATVFSSWLLMVRGVVRRTGPRGISLRATGAWDLQTLHQLWVQALDAGAGHEQAVAAVRAVIDADPVDFFAMVGERLDQPVPTDGSAREPQPDAKPDAQQHGRGGGMGRRRVLVHPSGFLQSPYADVQPAGTPASQPPRKLWHSSPGSSGR